MSLINNMLKELEQRDMKNRDAVYIPMTQVHASHSLFSSIKKIFIFMPIFFLIAIIAMMLMAHHKKPSDVVVQKNQNVIQSDSLPIAVNPEWIKPVLITGVTFQIKDNVTEIAFLLDHASLYRLISHHDENQLSLIIDHAQLQSAIPFMRYPNSAIEQLTTQVVNGDTRFNVLLRPGTTIQYIKLNEDDAHPELRMAFEYHPVLSTRSSQPNAVIVKTAAIQSILAKQYQDALYAVKIGNDAAAISQLISLLKIDPDYQDARTSLVALLIDHNDQAKAMQMIDAGLMLHPDYLPFVELKARVLVLKGKTKEAIALLQNASPPITENPDYYAFIAALYERDNDNQLAAKLYKQLLVLNDNNANWWLGLGVSLEKLNDKKGAVQAYNKALSEGQLNAESMTYLQSRLQTLEAAHDTE